jgi:hypothetical protein
MLIDGNHSGSLPQTNGFQCRIQCRTGTQATNPIFLFFELRRFETAFLRKFPLIHGMSHGNRDQHRHILNPFCLGKYQYTDFLSFCP